MTAKSALKRAWLGEESLSLVFWGYYVLGAFGVSLLLGLVAVTGQIHNFPILRWISVALALIYFVWAVVSVWRCAFNIKNKIYGYIARIIVVLGAASMVSRIVSPLYAGW
jgi:hypothetical protein